MVVTHDGRLAARMNPGIRPSGTRYAHRLVAQSGQCRLEHALHRSLRRLNLPAGEVAAIVVQNELQGTSRHHGKSSRAHTRHQARFVPRAIAEPIDFA